MRGVGQTVRLFESDVLERLSRVSPLVPALLWAPLALGLLWRSFAIHHLRGGALTALAAGGLVVWSLAEYGLHRFVFHLAPSSQGRRRLQFIIHGVHHEDPDDPRRLLMPPVPAAVMAAAFYGLFRMILGPAWVDPFFAGFLAGYLAYDYTHLTIHRGPARTRLLRYLRRHHMRHHFATPDACWGVTSPLWDWAFGTMGSQAVSRRRVAAAG